MKSFTEDLDKNLKIYSIQDWKKILSTELAFIFTTKPYNINPGVLFRGRSNFDSDYKRVEFFNHVDDLWSPPDECIKKDSRCTVKGKSTLYCSNSVTTTLFEVRPNTGDEVTFIKYSTLGNIENLGIVGAKEIILIGDDCKRIFGGHFNGSTKNSEILDDILTNIFKAVRSEERPIYNLTNAIFQTFTDPPQLGAIPDFLKPPKFNGMIYPSIATKKILGMNFALEPNAVKKLLKPVIAFKYNVLNKHDEHRYEIILTHKTNKIEADGNMSWVKTVDPKVEYITDL